jgi:site-specific recombinase XerD
MLAISFQGALRESELLNLEPKDFDFNNWDETSPLTFKVIGKGNKSRQVFINSDVALTLRHYIEEVKLNLGLNDYNFKLFSNKGNGIGARRWQIILSDISFRAIGKRVHPHMIRHSFAMYAHDELKWTLEMIGKYLGHSSLQVTTIYARTSTKQLSEAFNKDFNKIEDRDE